MGGQNEHNPPAYPWPSRLSGSAGNFIRAEHPSTFSRQGTIARAMGMLFFDM